MENLTACARYINKNYIRLIECRKGLCMVYVNELGRLLLEQGWSEAEVVELGYGNNEEEEMITIKRKMIPPIVPTYPVTESSTEEILVTEMMRAAEDDPSITTTLAAEGMSDLMADMLISETTTTPVWESVTSAFQEAAALISENSTMSAWESVTSASQQASDLISEGLKSVAKNVTEGNLGDNFTSPDSEFFSVKTRDYFSIVPGTFQLSTLFITASAVLQSASKYILRVIM
jgi:hypothetical protein